MSTQVRDRMRAERHGVKEYLEVTTDGDNLVVVGSVTIDMQEISVCKRGDDLYVHLSDTEKAKGKKMDLGTLVAVAVATVEEKADALDKTWKLMKRKVKGIVINGKVDEFAFIHKK